MNFISCNEHKDENSVYKFGAQFNVLNFLEKLIFSLNQEISITFL